LKRPFSRSQAASANVPDGGCELPDWPASEREEMSRMDCPQEDAALVTQRAGLEPLRVVEAVSSREE
jgi:hypothetical protein